MSLSILLSESDVKQRFRETFTKPAFRADADLLVEPRTQHWGLVGTAFDYVMRFQLRQWNSHAEGRTWVAERTLDISDPVIVPEETKTHIRGIIQEAKKNRVAFLDSESLRDGLLESALKLAKIDAVFRSKRPPGALDEVDSEDVQDLREMVELAKKDEFEAEDHCALNPVFNEASYLVGGADADLIIDGRLIDIKVTKNFRFDRDMFNQLMGYYLLWRLSGSTPEASIEEIGIYYPRQAYLHLLELDPIVEDVELSESLEWFIKRAADHSGYDGHLG